jgi:hypothetical protein
LGVLIGIDPQPNTVHRLAVIVEDVLAAIVGAENWASGAVL